MSQAAQALREVLAASGEQTDAQLLSSCGAAIARSAPSTSGTLVATGFLRAAKALAEPPDNPVEALVRAFAVATEGIQARGKAAVGDRTLVDGLDAVTNSLGLSLSSGLNTKEALSQAARAAAAAAEATAEMEPKAGRLRAGCPNEPRVTPMPVAKCWPSPWRPWPLRPVRPEGQTETPLACTMA